MRSVIILFGLSFFMCLACANNREISTFTPITTCQDLQNISLNTEGNYALINDIDCKEFAWKPIGAFYGSLTGKNLETGKNYSIENININLSSLSETDGVGALFGQVRNATITDITLNNINFTLKSRVSAVGIRAMRISCV